MAKDEITYKGYTIVKDNLLGYSLYNKTSWCSSDHTIEDMKKLVDLLLTFDHLDWEIKYLDDDDNVIYSFVEKDCSERRAETVALKNKPDKAVNWTILKV
jgi:hypothetical protein